MTEQFSLALLGRFQATCNGKPITAFNSDKTRALLAYLVVEGKRPHRREVLMGLFWPEAGGRRARANVNGERGNVL